MSAIESGGELTIPAALAANKHKIPRKSAKGRKLMRWGRELTPLLLLEASILTAFPADEDQQLLLATEAVIIEGTVELDWNLVGEKMPQMVTGEAIKQHLYKVREARESAGMVTPAKGEGKSAFGTRRGVTRYPPPANPDSPPTPKTRSRPQLRAPRNRARKSRGEDEEEEEEEVVEKKPKTPSKIKHRSLLFGPAVPRGDDSPSPEPTASGLIVTLPNKKRKVKEEAEAEEQLEAEDDPVATPKAPRKRAKKDKLAPNVNVDGSPVKKGRRHLGSSFDWEEREKKLKLQRESEASQVLAPAEKEVEMEKAPIVKPKPETKVAVSTNENNADVRKYFKPTVKQVPKSKLKETVTLADAPVYTERPLRTKANRPDYREQQAILSDDQQSELIEGASAAKDDAYEPEILPDTKPGLVARNEEVDAAKRKSVNVGQGVFDDLIDSSVFGEATSPQPEQDQFQVEHENYQSSKMGVEQPFTDQTPWPAEQEVFFTGMPDMVRGNAVFPPINTGHHSNFIQTGYGRPADAPDPRLFVNKPADNRAWYGQFEESVPTPAPAYNPIFGRDSAPHFDQKINTGFGSFSTNTSYSYPQANANDELVDQALGGQMQDGGLNFDAFTNSDYVYPWEADQSGDYELMQ